MTTPYRQLTQGQRYQIEAGLRAKESQASIAKQVGVHPSTISREVRRNRPENIYKAICATQESYVRRVGARKFCKPIAWLSHHLAIWLKHGMSPEQIAHRLKQEKPDQAVSHEWIYRFIAT
ncbi:helix-turn-helix domain-containing protein, partial [Pseudomonas sp. Dout3]